MEQTDPICCNGIWFNSHGKNKRILKLVDKITSPPIKRQKSNTSKQRRRSTCTREDLLNLSFQEDYYNAEIDTSQNNLHAKSSTENRTVTIHDLITLENNQQIENKYSSNPRRVSQRLSIAQKNKNYHAFDDDALYYMQRNYKNRDGAVDTAFVAEKLPISKNKLFLCLPKKDLKKSKIDMNIAFVADDACGQKKLVTKQRRLSGLFPTTSLNTGFLEDTNLKEKENAQTFEVNDTSWCQENFSIVEDDFTSEPLEENSNNSSISSNTTPVKTKLRKRPVKKLTEEDIIKYYTDKTIKKRQNTLETIFEAPTIQKMSVRKYRRFINFNERMSSNKLKKRRTKVVKNKLWSKFDTVSMEYFVNKMADVEIGL